MFIIAGINSPFRACDRFSAMVKHIYTMVYLLSAEQNYFCLRCSLSPFQCALLPLSPSSSLLSLISPSAPRLLRHMGEKTRQGSFQVRWDSEAARARKRSCWDVSLKEVPQRDHKGLQAWMPGFICINTKMKTGPLLTCLFPLNRNKTNMSKRVNTDLPSVSCVTADRGCSLGLVFSSATIAQPPWWPHGFLGRSLLWSVVPGCPSQQCRASAGLPALLSQVSALLLAPASPFLQQIQPFLPLPSMKGWYSLTWQATA